MCCSAHSHGRVCPVKEGGRAVMRAARRARQAGLAEHLRGAVPADCRAAGAARGCRHRRLHHPALHQAQGGRHAGARCAARPAASRSCAPCRPAQPRAPRPPDASRRTESSAMSMEHMHSSSPGRLRACCAAAWQHSVRARCSLTLGSAPEASFVPAIRSWRRSTGSTARQSSTWASARSAAAQACGMRMWLASTMLRLTSTP